MDSELSHYANYKWPHHMKRCAEFMTCLIEQNNNFFDEESELRQQWWTTYGGYLLRETNILRLHFACLFGLKQWVEILLRSRTRLLRPLKRILN